MLPLPSTIYYHPTHTRSFDVSRFIRLTLTLEMVAIPETLAPRGGDNGASHGQRALVVTAVLTGFSFVVVAMRFYARLGLMKMSGREDWAILIALVCLPDRRQVDV